MYFFQERILPWVLEIDFAQGDLDFVDQIHTTHTNLDSRSIQSCFSPFTCMEVTAVFLIQLES